MFAANNREDGYLAEMYLQSLKETGRWDYEVEAVDRDEYNQDCREEMLKNDMDEIPENWQDWCGVYLEYTQDIVGVDLKANAMTVKELNEVMTH